MVTSSVVSVAGSVTGWMQQGQRWYRRRPRRTTYEWPEGRRYLGLDVLSRSHTNTLDNQAAIEAITA